MNSQTLNLSPRNPNLSLFFLIIVLSQTFLLIYMIGERQFILNTGTSVILEVVPVDPRSLFSGDYVRLNYKISNIDLNDTPGDKDFKMGDTVYVTLQNSKPIYISKTFPTNVNRITNANNVNDTNNKNNTDNINNASPQVVIRGIATNKYESDSKTILSVWYGIEQYYVPESSGTALEQAAVKKQLSVKVKVDKSGRPAIAGLVADGQEIYQETLF